MADSIVFDKAKWHFEGDYPDDLGAEQAYVHTGLFLGWIIDNHLYSSDFEEEFAKEITKFKARQMTGPDVYKAGDGVFMDEMLNDEGLEFAQAYFDFDKGEYLKDYEKVLTKKLPTMYHVKDSWENYNLLKPCIDKRFAAWRQKRGSK